MNVTELPWRDRARLAHAVRRMLRENPGCTQIGAGWDDDGSASFAVTWEYRGDGLWRACAVSEDCWLVVAEIRDTGLIEAPGASQRSAGAREKEKA